MSRYPPQRCAAGPDGINVESGARGAMEPKSKCFVRENSCEGMLGGSLAPHPLMSVNCLCDVFVRASPALRAVYSCSLCRSSSPTPRFFASQSLPRLLVRRAQRRRGWRSTQVSRALGHECLPCAPVHVDWTFWNGTATALGGLASHSI